MHGHWSRLSGSRVTPEAHFSELGAIVDDAPKEGAHLLDSHLINAAVQCREESRHKDAVGIGQGRQQ